MYINVFQLLKHFGILIAMDVFSATKDEFKRLKKPARSGFNVCYAAYLCYAMPFLTSHLNYYVSLLKKGTSNNPLEENHLLSVIL